MSKENQTSEREPLKLDGNPPEPKLRFLGKSASIKVDDEVARNLEAISAGLRKSVPGVTLTAADLFRHAASVAADNFTVNATYLPIRPGSVLITVDETTDFYAEGSE